MTETRGLSAADEARIRRINRRAARAEMRDACFVALAEGWTQEQIAKARGVSVATVRREIDRAIAARQIRAPEAHARLQIVRLTKALALLDIRISAGEMPAVGPYLKTVAALDRYHGFVAPEAPAPTGGGLSRLPAPPLALTHASRSRGSAAAERAPIRRVETGGREREYARNLLQSLVFGRSAARPK